MRLAGCCGPTQGALCWMIGAIGLTAQNICLPAHQRGLGYVFQEAGCFPHMSVRRELAVWARRARRHQAIRMGWGRSGHAWQSAICFKRRPAALSGGEKQRVGDWPGLALATRLILAGPSPLPHWIRRARMKSCRISNACAIRPGTPFCMSAIRLTKWRAWLPASSA